MRQRLARGGEPLQGLADQLLDMQLALADAAPADRIEIGAVDGAAELAQALRPGCDRHSRASSRNRSRSCGRARCPRTAIRPVADWRDSPSSRARAADSGGRGDASRRPRRAYSRSGRPSSRRGRSSGSAKRSGMKPRAWATATLRPSSPRVSWKKPGRTWRSFVGVPRRTKNSCCGRVVDHPVGARDQELGRDGDGPRVAHHAVGRVVASRAGC